MCDADDDAGSKAVCTAFGVDAIFAVNRGVVWNKNCGLFHFMSRTDCDPIILVEDDAWPIEAGWLDKWIEAASLWDHVNFSYPKLVRVGGPYLAGDGTPGQPHINRLVSGQCTAVSRHAMQTGGYLDTRFKGYGHGHVEWSRRHASLLYRGKVDGFSDDNMLFLSIEGGVSADDAPSFRNEDQLVRNQELLLRTVRRTPDYLEPWQSDAEREILMQEIGAPAATDPVDNSSTSEPKSAPIHRGNVDFVSARHDTMRVKGWAAGPDGAPASNLLVKVGDRTIVDKIVRRMDRPDVLRVHPDIRLGLRFRAFIRTPGRRTRFWADRNLPSCRSTQGSSAGACMLRSPLSWPPHGWQPVPDAPTMPADGASAAGTTAARFALLPRIWRRRQHR